MPRKYVKRSYRPGTCKRCGKAGVVNAGGHCPPCRIRLERDSKCNACHAPLGGGTGPICLLCREAAAWSGHGYANRPPKDRRAELVREYAQKAARELPLFG